MRTATRSTRQRRLALGLTAAAVVAAAASGCGAASDEPLAGAGTASPTVQAPVDGAGPGEPSPAPAAGGGQPAEGTGFPGQALPYAQAVIAAWHAGELERLDELTTPLVHEQLIQIPGSPSADWTNIQCDGGDCSFYNGDGDYLLLHIQLSQFGQPHAASHVTFQPITYPLVALDYLQEFVTAWQRGNLAGMQALAVPEVVAVFQQLSPGPVSGYGEIGGGAGLARIVVTTVGAEVETQLGTTLLGGPQAIRAAIAEQ